MGSTENSVKKIYGFYKIVKAESDGRYCEPSSLLSVVERKPREIKKQALGSGRKDI